MSHSCLRILQLIDKLTNSVGETADHKGFGIVVKKTNLKDISPRYLYDLYRRTEEYFNEGQLNTQASRKYLDIISQCLGYTSFSQFTITSDNHSSATLEACIGNWWSYVRASTGNFLYKAPVRIFEDIKSKSIKIELQGDSRLFCGEVEEKGGCLFAYLKSGTDKQIGLILKLGSALKFDVIQGVFCGISSSGNPIAGREILVKEGFVTDFQYMKWAKVSIDHETIDSRIRDYFFDLAKNSIQISNVGDYTLNTLGS